LRACKLLGIQHDLMGEFLKTSEPALTVEEFSLQYKSSRKAYERALDVIEIYQLLECLMNGSAHLTKIWMAAENEHFSEAPISVIARHGGLVELKQYLRSVVHHH